MITDSQLEKAARIRRQEQNGLNRSKPVSTGTMLEIVDMLSKKIAEAGAQNDALSSQLSKATARLAHLEKNAMTWRGDWHSGPIYPASCIVRHAGGLFVALTETTQEPGAPSAPWSQI